MAIIDTHRPAALASSLRRAHALFTQVARN